MTNQNLSINELNEHTMLIHLEFHMISGRKKLQEEDLNLPADVKLPPETVASLGTKKFIDPEKINEFTRIKEKAKRECLKYGVRFLGGYAVPKTKVDEVLAEVDVCINDFKDKKNDFINNYENIINQWCAANPEWETIFRQAVTPKAKVEMSFGADYSVYQVQPSANYEARINQKTSSLGDTLFDEIAKETEYFIDQSLKVKQGKNAKRFRNGNEGVTQRALSPIKRIREKLEGLAFINGNEIFPVIKHIDNTLNKLPSKGRINDQDFNNLVSLAITLSSKENIKQLSSGLILDTSDELFDEGFDLSSSTNLEGSEIDTESSDEVHVSDEEIHTETLQDDFDATLNHSEVNDGIEVSDMADVFNQEEIAELEALLADSIVGVQKTEHVQGNESALNALPESDFTTSFDNVGVDSDIDEDIDEDFIGLTDSISNVELDSDFSIDAAADFF
jgi:hypothetical protein